MDWLVTSPQECPEVEPLTPEITIIEDEIGVEEVEVPAQTDFEITSETVSQVIAEEKQEAIFPFVFSCG